MSNKADIIKGLLDKVELSKTAREDILRILALKDAKIDEIDELIVNIDKQIPDLIANINNTVNPIKSAYDARINNGCRSDITWEVTETGTDENDDDYTIYTVVKNNTRQETNFYGQKYYRKPLNRDFGSNIIAEIVGDIRNIPTGITTIAVTSDNGIEGVEVGDIVTDNLDKPTIFSAGNLPRVTGFGTTTIVGFNTTVQGTIGVGSDHFVASGAGSTLAVEVGSAVTFTGVVPEGTTVIGFGTAIANLPFYNDDNGLTTTVPRVFPSIILSNIATDSSTLGLLSVGITSTKPTLILDKQAASEATEESFIIIRDTKDIDSDFDFEKSPLEPVTIGILGNQLGIGHKTEIVNNGPPPGPKQWNEQQDDPEPAVGAGKVVYYEGNFSWPIITTDGEAGFGGVSNYATLGQTLVSTSSTLTESTSVATLTPVSPTPGADCAASDASIATANTNFANAVTDNLTKAQNLNALSQALREFRDEEELEAYGLLQGAAFERSRANTRQSQSDTFTAQDLTEYDP